MLWTVPVSSKGQLTLPAPLRKELGVIPGQDNVLLQKQRGDIVIKSAKKTLYDLAGVLEDHPRKGLSWKDVSRIARHARAIHAARNG